MSECKIQNAKCKVQNEKYSPEGTWGLEAGPGGRLNMQQRRKELRATSEPVTAGSAMGNVKQQAEVSSLAAHAKLPPEARAQLAAREKMMADVVTFAKDNPEEASQLLRVWLTGGEPPKPA